MLAVWVVIGVAVVGLPLGLVWRFGAARRILRLLRASPLVSIRDAREGVPNRISGRALPWGQTLEAPLTGRPCLYYEATIDQLVRGQRGAGRWVRIAHEVMGAPFLVEDGTGRAVVDPTGATVALHVDASVRAGIPDRSNPRVRAFVDRYYLEREDERHLTELRYREGVIEVGEKVTALGAGVREPDPDGAGEASGYREAGPTRLRVAGSARLPLYLTDRVDEV
jgi:hypothetical protein